MHQTLSIFHRLMLVVVALGCLLGQASVAMCVALDGSVSVGVAPAGCCGSEMHNGEVLLSPERSTSGTDCPVPCVCVVVESDHERSISRPLRLDDRSGPTAVVAHDPCFTTSLARGVATLAPPLLTSASPPVTVPVLRC